MVSKKQRFRTVILILIFAVAIVGGVFAISYYNGNVTFPWQVVSSDADNENSASEPEAGELEETKTTEEINTTEKAETSEKSREVLGKDKAETKGNDTGDATVISDDETEKEADIEEISSEEASNKESDDDESKSDVATTGKQLDYYGKLHVEDGSLVDEDGNVAQLTGVSSHGLSWYPEFVTADAIASLRENLGINVIRLAVYTSDYNGYCVAEEDIREAIKSNIDEAVEAAVDNDMYVIIDWHILNDGDPNEYKSQAIQFFGELVRKYKNYDNVIYEICNEPNGDTTWADIKRYAKEVIPVIRNVNKDAIILVGVPEWSSDLDAAGDDPLDFDNIMYTYHFYVGSHKSSARKALTDALEDGLPVFISEYGFTTADGDGDIDTKEAAKWQEIMDEHQLSSCIWNLSNKDEGSALINADCDKTYDFEYDDYSDQGKYFFDQLKENNNDN